MYRSVEFILSLSPEYFMILDAVQDNWVIRYLFGRSSVRKILNLYS